MTEIVRAARSESWRRDFIATAKGRCHYCNRTGASETIGPDNRPWHIDHMNPLARGGEDVEENLVLACKRCNLTKGAQPYKRFKEFARLAFWTPTDWRLSEYELNALMNSFTGVRDRHAPETEQWRVDAENLRIIRDAADEGHFESVLYLGDRVAAAEDWDHFKRMHEGPSEYGLLSLVVEMHKALPKLIAEIRMLRAELGIEESEAA